MLVLYLHFLFFRVFFLSFFSFLFFFAYSHHAHIYSSIQFSIYSILTLDKTFIQHTKNNNKVFCSLVFFYILHKDAQLFFLIFYKLAEKIQQREGNFFFNFFQFFEMSIFLRGRGQAETEILIFFLKKIFFAHAEINFFIHVAHFSADTIL